MMERPMLLAINGPHKGSRMEPWVGREHGYLVVNFENFVDATERDALVYKDDFLMLKNTSIQKMDEPND